MARFFNVGGNTVSKRKISFKLPVPISVNKIYKYSWKGGVYKSTEARVWEEEAGWALKGQPTFLEINVPIKMEIKLYVKFASDLDIDNGLKITLDLLQKYKVYKNDNLIEELSIQRIVIPKPHKPHMTINIFY